MVFLQLDVYRKQKTKEYVKFLALKVLAVVSEISVTGAYKRVLKQYLTEKQNDYL